MIALLLQDTGEAVSFLGAYQQLPAIERFNGQSLLPAQVTNRAVTSPWSDAPSADKILICHRDVSDFRPTDTLFDKRHGRYANLIIIDVGGALHCSK